MKLGGYTIGDAAWEDPASTIYSGAEPGTNRRVLIRIPKLTARPAKDFERLRRDHEIARALPPEVVIRPITLERFEGGVALVLEDAGARPLRQIIATRPLSLDEILTIGIGLAVATGQLHARRIIHKNITPDSVWWREDSGEVFLTDFSIASRGTEEGRQMQVAGQIEGQLAYTSPEQTGRLLRVVDHRADHYATGILLYRLLTGRLPFTSVDPIQLVHGHLAQIPPTPRELDSKIPATVSAIVMKLLAKAPDARYQSAHGLLADLRECATQRRAGTRIEEFPLGAHDSFETFQISQKLYGRDTARAALRACFTRAAADVAELVLVAGAPGAGKSVLVSDAQQSILEANGYYAGGKFDQFSQNVPYSAFAGALKELFDQLLTRPDAELSAWRERLHDALGNSGQVLVDVIPTLELITGPFPPVPSLPIEEARNRFNLSFRDLIRALASAEHPLVLFLDDLQWADAGSIGLLKLLAVDRQTRHLLVIGTYRDTEVGPDHRLSALLRELAAAGVHPTRIEVRPLAAETISDLLVDTLRCTRESARELAQLIEKKTEGNPFFVGQFIQFLYDEGLLQFDQALQSWSGDLLKIEAEGITDNVLDLMATKIARLDADARATLKLAACLGASFSLERASVVTERPREAVLDDLRNAWREGLLVSRASVGDSGNTDAIGGAGNPEFHFLHDRVQQAAYKLIPESELPKTHFRVGRLLQARLSVEELSASPFEVVNNLNRGLGLVSERDERRELAQLNLVAARKAQEGTAYEAALEYVRTGVSLLPDDRWAAHYDLTRDLHFRKLQCEFITGSFTEADQTFEVLQTNVTDPVDRASVVNQKIIIDVSTERSEAAIDLGVSALHDLGVHIPGHPNKLQLLWEFAKSKYLVGRRSPAELLGLPLMNDRRREAAVLLLNTITVPAYIARPDLMAFAAARTVNMSIQHGNSEPSVMGYVVHALVVGSGFGDYKNGFEFGRMSVALSERFNNVGFQCKAAFTFAGFVNWWRRPIETSLALHERAYRLALDAGDMQFAVFAVIHIITEHVYKGTSLEEVKSLADRYQPFVDQSGHDFARIISVTRQWVLALQGKTVNGTMTTDTFDEEAVFNDIVQSGNYSALSYIVWYRLQLAYLGGDFTGAHKMAAMQHEKIDRTLGQVMQADNYFYFGLTAAALSRVEPQHAKKYLKILKRGHTRLRRWAPNCPENFQDRFLLLDAELSAINGQSSALSKYDAAIAAAEARACTHNAAIANELAGRHALRQGQRIVAQVYLRAATAAFEQWGAHGKVQNLVDEFPDLALAPAVALPSVRREVSGW